MIKYKDNMVVILLGLIKGLNVRVSSFTVRKTLLSHPDYPSLLAISECLKEWNVPHETFRADKNDVDVNEITFPFIANLSPHGGNLVLVHDINSGKVKYSDCLNRYVIIDEADFISQWDGIVLLAENSTKSGEKNYKKAVVDGLVQSATYPILLTTLAVCIISSLIVQNPGSGIIVLSFLKSIGIVISILLLIHSFDADNNYLKRVCNFGNSGDCSNILNSDSAKLNNWLSWSEVGFFYFTGSFACLLLFPSSILYLKWLNILCLPYTLYSIGYQIIKKTWCILCCSVQLLLWLEAMTFSFYGDTLINGIKNTISPVQASIFLLPFLMIMSIWMLIKPKIQTIVDMPAIKKQLSRFKSDSELFHQLLVRQSKYTIPNSLQPIILGDKNAGTIITVVSGPFCGACGRAHKYIEEWSENDGDIQFQFIFTHPNIDNDVRTIVSRHLSSLVLTSDNLTAKNGMRDWYGKMDKSYGKWAAKYPANFSDDISALAQQQYEWCRSADIAVTPTYFINGYKLMDYYDLDDIKYLIS